MRQAQPSFPPATSFLWILTAYVECALLHLRFRSRSARRARLALCPLVLALGRQAANEAFAPRDTTRAVNIAWGFMCVYGAWKAIEWAVVDEVEYEWIGFEKGDQQGRKSAQEGNGALESGKAPSKSQVGMVQVLLEQLHLFTSFRMMGYRAYRGPLPTHRLSTRSFVLRTLAQATLSHVLILACIAWLASPVSSQLGLILLARPGLGSQARTLRIVRAVVDWLGVGFFVMSSLSYLQCLFALAQLASHAVNDVLGKPLPLAPFDNRDWAPLFYRPLFPTSVQALWATHWHQLLRRPFQAMSGTVYEFVRRATGSELGARFAGLATVAGMTDLIHHYPLQWSVPDTLSFKTTWRERNGGHAFFVVMGGLTVLEKVFTNVTGRRVRGVPGYLWAAASVLPAIVYLLPPAWAGLGLTEGLARWEEWGWQRWWVPFGCAVPEGLWMR